MDLFSPNGDRLARALLVARDHYGKSTVLFAERRRASSTQGTYAFIYPSDRAGKRYTQRAGGRRQELHLCTKIANENPRDRLATIDRPAARVEHQLRRRILLRTLNRL